MLRSRDYELIIVGSIRSRFHAQYGHLSAIMQSMKKRAADSSVGMNRSIQSQMTQAMEQSILQASEIDRYVDSEVMGEIYGACTTGPAVEKLFIDTRDGCVVRAQKTSYECRNFTSFDAR